VGCRRGISPSHSVLRCHFAESGFPLDRVTNSQPCGSAYHVDCFRAGPPFKTRRLHGQGLVFPKIRIWPIFVCEACTVRAFLGRELHGLRDWQLLCLERMRILDVAHAWSPGTHSVYQAKFRVLQQFSQSFGVPILNTPTLSAPPTPTEIPLMWAHEFYSLIRSRAGRTRSLPLAEQPGASFGTIRQLRSAVAQFESLALLSTEPGRTVADRNQVWISQCRLTDSHALSLFMTGLGSRIGAETKPSTALLDRHVRWIDADLNNKYLACNSLSTRRELARAGLVNLLLWLGWLRSGEVFGLTVASVECIPPTLGSSKDLPKNVGALLLRLQPETKTSRSKTADVVIAYQTVSGFCPGKWWLRLVRSNGFRPDQRPLRPSDLLFVHDDNTLWTSHYFRHAYLYPALASQKLLGDPFLHAFDDSPGNSLPEKFWSLHSYRRGSRTTCQRRNQGCPRKASHSEVYEHARWRRRRAGEAIDIAYREWTLRDRVKISLLSM